MHDSAIHALRHIFRRSIAAALLLGPAAFAFAAELPSFRQGLWEFNRSIQPQSPSGKPTTVADKRCTDPTADMKRMNDMLAKQGCRFSPVSASGNVFTFSSTCQIQNVSAQSSSTLTRESDSAYTVQVASTGSAGASKELLVAKRVGDCKP